MHCKDTWKRHIPNDKLFAYKQMINEGMIIDHHVVYERKTGITTVEYKSEKPHEWILEEMKRRCANETGC